MKRTTKKKCGIYEYLEASGVLETGSDEAITEARKQYWREYKKEWVRNKRSSKKQYTIYLNPSEHKLISQSAKKYGNSITRFIKEASIATAQKQHLVANPMTLNYIREALTLNYNIIAQLEEEDKISVKTEQMLIEKINSLERTVMEKLLKSDR